MRAFCIGVTIRDLDFNDKSHQRRLNTSTDITSDIFSQCKELLSELWDAKKPLRLLGVSLTEVVSDEEDNVQISFFDTDKKDKARTIDKTVDNIRNRFGDDMIVRGGIYKENIRVGKKHRKKEE